MIPIIPGVIVGKAIYDMHKSDKLNEQAEKKNMRSFDKIADARIAQKEAEEEMNQAVLRLTNRKKAILSTSMRDFLNVYEKLMKINFTESDGIYELKNFTPTLAEELHIQLSLVQNMPQTPVITKNVVVGYLIGGFVGAVTSSIVDDSRKNLDIARLQARQAEVIVQQTEGINLAYQAITERTKLMTDVLTKLNALFVKSIRYTGSLIDEKGKEKSRYNIEDRKALAVCINVAGTIKAILDAPIIDKDGKVTKKSLETIQLGEQYLQAMDFAMIND